MPEQTQTYANHPRYLPLFHFIAFPILLINFIVQVVQSVRYPSGGTIWAAVVAFALAAGLLLARHMALRVQDRLIRLEERLRLARILPADLQGAIDGLRVRHLIGLRFAADQEVPDLVRRIQKGELTAEKEIKQAIRNWRADWLRV